MFDGEREQVGVGDLSGTGQPVPSQPPRLQQTDRVRPKGVGVLFGGLRQAPGDLERGYGIGVGRMQKNPDAAVLGRRARRPTPVDVRDQPIRGEAMVEMARVQEGDQDIDSQQRPHRTPLASRNRFRFLSKAPHADRTIKKLRIT